VISAITGASEPVKVKSPTPKRSLTVPQGAKIAAFKICSIPAAA
jgi:hypothetical protein